MTHLPMEETQVFEKFLQVAHRGWEIVQAWKAFPKSTLGSQLVRSLDSICANLVEGDGRYSDGEAIHYFTIARASAREAKYWISISIRRGLIDQAVSTELIDSLNQGTKMPNKLIEYRRRTKNQSAVREDISTYISNLTQDDTATTESALTPNAYSFASLFHQPPLES